MQNCLSKRARRRQLNAIRRAVYAHRNGLPSRRSGYALGVGVFTAFVVAVWLQSGVVVPFGTGLVASVTSYFLMQLTTSWADELDRLLAAYEPVNVDAYASLLEDTKEGGGLALQKVEAWLAEELATEERLPSVLFLHKLLPPRS